VWEYPPNPKSRSPRMLVTKKGTTKDLQLSGLPVAGNLPSQPVKNGIGPSVYEGLVPKLAAPPTKPSNGKAKLKKILLGLLSLMNLHIVLTTLMLLNQLPRILIHQQIQ
jgi:hypothetical protein